MRAHYHPLSASCDLNIAYTCALDHSAQIPDCGKWDSAVCPRCMTCVEEQLGFMHTKLQSSAESGSVLCHALRDPSSWRRRCFNTP